MTDAVSLRQVLMKNTSVQMVATAASLGLGLVTTMVLSRTLGVERFGRFNYLFAFYYFFLTLNDFGVNTIVIREISQARARAGEILGATLSFKAVVAVLSVLAAWVTIALVDFPPELKASLSVYALVLPLLALQLPSVMYHVLWKIDRLAVLGMVNRVIGFLLLMTIVWLGYGPTAMAAVLVVAEGVYLLLLWWDTRALVQPIWHWPRRGWIPILRSSLPLGLTGVCVAVINRADFILLERMTDLHQVGLYAAAYKVTSLLESFPLILMTTLYPAMSQYAGADRPRLRQLYHKSLGVLAAVALPMGLLVTFGAPMIVRALFGARFVGAERGLAALVWSTVCLYPAICGGNLLISMGRERINLAINIVGAIMNITLNLFLIPRLGFVGSALATSATYLVILLVILVEAERALRAAPRATA